MLAGYMVYAPWTAVIKALMGALVAWMLRRSKFRNYLSAQAAGEKAPKGGLWAAAPATAAAGLVNVGGYFLVECFMYTPAGALAGVPMNCLQSAFGVVLFFILAPAFSRVLHSISEK